VDRLPENYRGTVKLALAGERGHPTGEPTYLVFEFSGRFFPGAAQQYLCDAVTPAAAINT